VRKKNKNITLTNILIEDYAAEGKSLARVDGKVIFVENAIPGDIVDIRLGKNKKDWAEGYVTAFRGYSPTAWSPFVRILASVGAVAGKCYPIPGNCSISNSRWRTLSAGSGR
jgi:23S rRNA (uracil1939-C5)-methyltransferase